MLRNQRSWDPQNGEGGIRTHAPLRTNGFQDRLVMTTSIPLQNMQFQGVRSHDALRAPQKQRRLILSNCRSGCQESFPP